MNRRCKDISITFTNVGINWQIVSYITYDLGFYSIWISSRVAVILITNGYFSFVTNHTQCITFVHPKLYSYILQIFVFTVKFSSLTLWKLSDCLCTRDKTLKNIGKCYYRSKYLSSALFLVMLPVLSGSTCSIFPCSSGLLHWPLAPVPLSIFRSNSKFDENSKHSSVKYTRPITTIFCTRHDSVTVVTCAKYRCDRSGIFETRAFWIFIEFRIRSKYA